MPDSTSELLEDAEVQKARRIAEASERAKELLERRDLARSDSEPNAHDKSKHKGVSKEFQKILDDEFERISKEKVENEDRKDPDIVLRNKIKKSKEKNEHGAIIGGLAELGWSDEKVKRIRELLKQRFGWTSKDKITATVDEERVINAIEIFIGSGKTADEVISGLEDEAKWQQARVRSEEIVKNSRGLSGEDIENYQKLSFLHDDLEIERIDYIKQFVLDREFEGELNDIFDSKRPKGLEELAWNIAWSKPEEFGVNGKFPILKMQVEKDPQTGRPKGKYIVNHANFVRWMYWQINEWYDIDTDDVTNYFSNIKINKDQFASVDLGTIFYDHTRFFTDENGHEHTDLYKQVFLLPWTLMQLRTYDLHYIHAMGSREGLAKKLGEEYFLNKLTKKSFGKSMFYYLTTLPVDYENLTDNDNKMGAAIMTMFLTYYNLADFEALQRVLGEDSSFFKRDDWIEALKQTHKGVVKQTDIPTYGNLLGDQAAVFDKAFKDKKTGEIKQEVQDENAFISFINYLNHGMAKKQQVEDVVQKALENAVARNLVSTQGDVNNKKFEEDSELEGEGYVLDRHSLGVAGLAARSMINFTGASARSDFPTLAADNGAVPLYRTEGYRRKMATPERGGSTGNPFTIPQFKQLVVPLLEGIPVEYATKEYQMVDKGGKVVTKSRRKTPMEVIQEMVERNMDFERERRKLINEIENEKTSEERKKLLQDELVKLEDIGKNDYKIIADQIGFDENVLRDYAGNHFANGVKLYDQIFGAHEIDFEKFTKYDSMFRGVSFDRAAFQKEVREEFLKPLRYLFQTYGALNMNMTVRAPVFTGRTYPDGKSKDNYVFRDMPLGEAIFGYQILNIPEFRQEFDDLQQTDPEKWKWMKSEGFKKKGKYIQRPDGRYEIDYNKVQENKVLAYKQWGLMKLGADMWAHITRHSTDPAYDMAHFTDILEAIESIPGEVFGSDENMTDTRVVKTMFDEKQMKWLKKISKTSTFRLFNRQFWTDIFGGKHKKDTLFGESAGIIMSAIFKGY